MGEVKDEETPIPRDGGGERDEADGKCLANGRRHLVSVIIALTPIIDAAMGVQIAMRYIESVTESKKDLLP